MCVSPAGNSVEYHLKLLVIGESGAGKTSIINRLCNNVFLTNYKATIGIDFALYILQINDNTTVRLHLWDIAGSERYGQMTRVYYKEAAGALIVYDATKSNWSEGVTKWKKDLDDKITQKDGKPLPTLLLANKCDLESAKAPDAATLTASNLPECILTSAKTDIGITDAITSIVRQILATGNHQPYQTAPEHTVQLTIDPLPKTTSSSSCTC